MCLNICTESHIACQLNHVLIVWIFPARHKSEGNTQVKVLSLRLQWIECTRMAGDCSQNTVIQLGLHWFPYISICHFWPASSLPLKASLLKCSFTGWGFERLLPLSRLLWILWGLSYFSSWVVSNFWPQNSRVTLGFPCGGLSQHHTQHVRNFLRKSFYRCNVCFVFCHHLTAPLI